MEVIEQYGADTLRWFLTNGSAPGQDVRYSTDKMDAVHGTSSIRFGTQAVTH